MPSSWAARWALERSRDAMAVTSARLQCFIAGITFLMAMPATPRTPQRILLVTFRSVLPPSLRRYDFSSRLHSPAAVAVLDRAGGPNHRQPGQPGHVLVDRREHHVHASATGNHEYDVDAHGTEPH